MLTLRYVTLRLLYQTSHFLQTWIINNWAISELFCLSIDNDEKYNKLYKSEYKLLFTTADKTNTEQRGYKFSLPLMTINKHKHT